MTVYYQSGIAEQTYRTMMLNHELIEPDEQKRLCALAAAGDKDAADKLVRGYQKMISGIAGYYALVSSMEYLDLVSEGNIGLLRAIEKFDPKRGFQFSTYSHFWIKQKIIRAINDQSHTIRRSVHSGELIRSAQKKSAVFEARNGRKPTLEELAKMVGKEPAWLRDMWAVWGKVTNISSLDEPDVITGREKYGSVALATNENEFEVEIEDRIEASELVQEQRERLTDAFVILNDDEITIMNMWAGVGGQEPLMDKHIALKLGESYSYIRNKRSGAIAKIQRAMPDGAWRKCECGKEIKRKLAHKYCSDACAEKGRKKSMKQYYARKRREYIVRKSRAMAAA